MKTPNLKCTGNCDSCLRRNWNYSSEVQHRICAANGHQYLSPKWYRDYPSKLSGKSISTK